MRFEKTEEESWAFKDEYLFKDAKGKIYQYGTRRSYFCWFSRRHLSAHNASVHWLAEGNFPLLLGVSKKTELGL